MLSNNPGLLALVVVFIAGALLFALGTMMVRREKQTQTQCHPDSPTMGEGSAAQDARSRSRVSKDRLDQIERLALVGQPWCVEQLEREFLTDSDADTRNAAEDALMVIRARGLI